MTQPHQDALRAAIARQVHLAAGASAPAREIVIDRILALLPQPAEPELEALKAALDWGAKHRVPLTEQEIAKVRLYNAVRACVVALRKPQEPKP